MIRGLVHRVIYKKRYKLRYEVTHGATRRTIARSDVTHGTIRGDTRINTHSCARSDAKCAGAMRAEIGRQGAVPPASKSKRLKYIKYHINRSYRGTRNERIAR